MSSEQRTTRPSASTTVAARRLSAVTPWRRIDRPKPPPSVSPAIPTVGQVPTGSDEPVRDDEVAEDVEHVRPAADAHDATVAVELDGVDPRDVGDDPAGDVRVAGEGVAPAAAGDRPAARAGEAHDLADVRGRLAEGDRARRDVQARVVERARRGPAGVARGDERAAQAAAQLGGGRAPATSWRSAAARARSPQRAPPRCRGARTGAACAVRPWGRTIWAARRSRGPLGRSRPRRCSARPAPRARSISVASSPASSAALPVGLGRRRTRRASASSPEHPRQRRRRRRRRRAGGIRVSRRRRRRRRRRPKRLERRPP